MVNQVKIYNQKQKNSLKKTQKVFFFVLGKSFVFSVFLSEFFNVFLIPIGSQLLLFFFLLKAELIIKEIRNTEEKYHNNNLGGTRPLLSSRNFINLVGFT